MVAKWKIEEVEELKNMLLNYPVIGIVDMEGMPAKQLQKIRALLRGNVVIKMSKRSLMQHALKKAMKEEKSLEGLSAHIKGQPAFAFSNISPFKLYKILDKNRASAPAKPNSISPEDIVVEKGETPFPPGPLLAELQQVGIPTAVSGGKIVVKENKIVARKGDKISPKLAAILARLGIEPMKIGLKLLAAYEKGSIFLSDILAVDEDKMVSELQQAYSYAVNLSLNSGYVTKETAPLALVKAFNNAKTLAVEAEIYEPAVIKEIIAKAHAQASYMESMITKMEVK